MFACLRVKLIYVIRACMCCPNVDLSTEMHKRTFDLCAKKIPAGIVLVRKNVFML